MQRELEREILDELPPEDPRAVHSRRDLRLVNWWMGHARLILRALLEDGRKPRTIIELGAGDGTLMMRLARATPGNWRGVRVVFLDRQPVISEETQRNIESHGWEVEICRRDLLEWLKEGGEGCDWMIANLFLHHFADGDLQKLFQVATDRVRHGFVSCDPRRSKTSMLLSKLLPLLGCNGVTRHDARVSVRAGFNGKELSRLWPEAGGFGLVEERRGLATHFFRAARV